MKKIELTLTINIVETTRDKQVADIIDKLKNLSGDGLDGETMQQILEAVGMEGQMLSQLVRGAEDREAIEQLLDESDEAWRERKRANRIATPKRRLELIVDEIKNIRKVIEANDEKIYELDAHPECAIGTLLNNIEIACDLEDSEPNQWDTDAEYEAKEKLKKSVK